MKTIRFGDPDAEFSGKIDSFNLYICFTKGEGFEIPLPKRNDKEEISEFIYDVETELKRKGLIDRMYIIKKALTKAGYSV